MGHHGSSTSTSQAFLNAVIPAYAVISAGINNQYGHPTQQTLDTLSTNNIVTYGTYNNGTIIFSLNSASQTTIPISSPSPSPTPTAIPPPSTHPTPSTVPTSAPTSNPTTSPTNAPTQDPPIQPTTQPTNNPAQTPTASPTISSTTNPSPTIPEFPSTLILLALIGLISLSIVTIRKRIFRIP